jgi:hypothetical protein
MLWTECVARECLFVERVCWLLEGMLEERQQAAAERERERGSRQRLLLAAARERERGYLLAYERGYVLAAPRGYLLAPPAPATACKRLPPT